MHSNASTAQVNYLERETEKEKERERERKRERGVVIKIFTYVLGECH